MLTGVGCFWALAPAGVAVEVGVGSGDCGVVVPEGVGVAVAVGAGWVDFSCGANKSAVGVGCGVALPREKETPWHPVATSVTTIKTIIIRHAFGNMYCSQFSSAVVWFSPVGAMHSIHAGVDDSSDFRGESS